MNYKNGPKLLLALNLRSGYLASHRLRVLNIEIALERLDLD